ncbi:MAG: response regulator [Bacilli bacterium]|nr:response regulator [Bacilli bacterium]
MKILIVDDSLINLKVEQKMLEKLNCRVETALSGEECLEKVKETTYDLIFMDIMMPNMDGVETFKKLQLLENFNTPVVTLTADVENDAKERYLKIGFNDYLSKPASMEQLKQVLNNYES